MFKNLIIVSFVLQLFLCFSSFAQLEIDRLERFYLDKKNIYQGESEEFKTTISLHGNYDINSNAISNSFVKNLLNGSFISDDIKGDVSKKLTGNNRGGLENYYGFTGTHHINDLTIIAGLGFREHLDLGFTKDLFEVLFRGNKGYANQTAALGPTKVNYFNYQNIYVGFSKKLSNSPVSIGGGISFIRGGKYQMLDISRGDLYTEQSGEYIQLNTKFSMDYTTPQSSYLASSGAGTAINLTFSRDGEKGFLKAEIRDLGFIHWNDNVNIKTDSSFLYEGEEIKNVLNYSNYTYNSINLDSIRNNFHIRKQTNGITRMLPFTFNINYTLKLTEKFNLMGGVKQIFNANYIPRVYVKGIFNIRENFLLTPGILYGGYGKLNFEMSAVKSFNDKFLISGSVVCLEYLLIPKQSQGLALQLNFTKIF